MSTERCGTRACPSGVMREKVDQMRKRYDPITAILAHLFPDDEGKIIRRICQADRLDDRCTNCPLNSSGTRVVTNS